ncbi:MAG: hypothetical protein RM347_014410 [Nostoc sp. ChiQUE02]|uniref:hypothetical protein n=1 Tax=Nostoc sp. ChiQUE02 TaxID=3075377 RepID=UPI002AD4129E|nr:hypothetical protein [Nostoc sp. ChiQUE02]MDZ8230150.1 hypothetical protein [Nostoc sp. ChiQUE02]
MAESLALWLLGECHVNSNSNLGSKGGGNNWQQLICSEGIEIGEAVGKRGFWCVFDTVVLPSKLRSQYLATSSQSEAKKY